MILSPLRGLTKQRALPTQGSRPGLNADAPTGLNKRTCLAPSGCKGGHKGRPYNSPRRGLEKGAES
jgi:hypothetical protein